MRVIPPAFAATRRSPASSRSPLFGIVSCSIISLAALIAGAMMSNRLDIKPLNIVVEHRVAQSFSEDAAQHLAKPTQSSTDGKRAYSGLLDPNSIFLASRSLSGETSPPAAAAAGLQQSANSLAGAFSPLSPQAAMPYDMPLAMQTATLEQSPTTPLDEADVGETATPKESAVPTPPNRSVKTADITAETKASLPAHRLNRENARENRINLARSSSKTPSTRSASTEGPSLLERIFGGRSADPAGPALSYAAPQDTILRDSTRPLSASNLSGYDSKTAIYDISARTVYLPSGKRLEAHSGLGGFIDDPRNVHLRMRGATPPHVYNLREREALFHGVRAIRLIPTGGEKAIFGRSGLLAHTYMLGPNGDSNGCVSFRDYQAFLRAYDNGEITRLAVVAGR